VVETGKENALFTTSRHRIQDFVTRFIHSNLPDILTERLQQLSPFRFQAMQNTPDLRFSLNLQSLTIQNKPRQTIQTSKFTQLIKLVNSPHSPKPPNSPTRQFTKLVNSSIHHTHQNHQICQTHQIVQLVTRHPAIPKLAHVHSLLRQLNLHLIDETKNKTNENKTKQNKTKTKQENSTNTHKHTGNSLTPPFTCPSTLSTHTNNESLFSKRLNKKFD
jgi:hypothetical protein